MTPIPLLAALFAVASGPAWADAFTWNPHPVGLNGSKFTADTMLLQDFARVTLHFDQGVSSLPNGDFLVPFTDNGILPIAGFKLNGRTVTPPDYGVRDGWGAFISYQSAGWEELHPTATGPMPIKANYGSLGYQLQGYNEGSSAIASFSFDSNGAAQIVGPYSNLRTLEQGSLLTGSLAFDPSLTITGEVQASVDEVLPQFVVSKPTGVTVDFLHFLEQDYSILSDTEIKIHAQTPNSTAGLQLNSGGSKQAAVLADILDPVVTVTNAEICAHARATIGHSARS